jgi:magnesium chelatase family protein
MPLAKSNAISLVGLTGTVVEVEADISSNLPGFVLVGLPDASLSEASARVRAAITNSGLALSQRKITVNLSPAAVPKFGSSFDLAIAVAVLAANKPFPKSHLSEWVHIGELALDGAVRPVNGVLPAVIAARGAGFKTVVVPAANYAEAKVVNAIEVLPVNNLRQVVKLHGVPIEEADALVVESADAHLPETDQQDISDIIGQDSAVESLVVAAAGGHHLLMIGSPGVGKTMMAERFANLLPDLSLEQSVETTAVHSIAKNRGLIGSSLISRPPFEAPHHSASAVSLIGGGSSIPTPGLVSLAHNGVLFLDEAPEFQQPALEVLRQALETGEVVISRAAGVARFPARFQLLLAANPCPCGNALNPKVACFCSPATRQRYMNKLSGPLLDRVDVRLQIQSINATQALLARQQKDRPTSNQARQRVVRAREISADRLAGTGFSLNAQIPASLLHSRYAVAPSARRTLDTSLKRGVISMRGYDRCLRLAYTLCDLDADAQVDETHIARAVLLRGAESNMRQAS